MQQTPSGCPHCGADRGRISEHPQRPGFHRCVNCGKLLVELRRQSSLGFEQIYYVAPGRPGVTVHEAPSQRHDEVPAKEI